MSLWLGNSGHGFLPPPFSSLSSGPHFSTREGPRGGEPSNHFNLLFFLLLAMHHKKHFLQALVFINSIFKETQVGEAVWVGFERVCGGCVFLLALLFTNLLFKDCDGRSTKQLSSHNQLWLEDNKQLFNVSLVSGKEGWHPLSLKLWPSLGPWVGQYAWLF